MRGYSESDPIETACFALEQAARKFASVYLADMFGQDRENAAYALRAAACAYAEVTKPKKRRRTTQDLPRKGATQK